MTETIHIAEDHTITRGDAAKKLLYTENDSRYLTQHGVISVPFSRWHAAQRYEKKCWMELHSGFVDDRNMFHELMFDEYEPLAGHEFENVIEVGCGPFTNMRRVLNVIKAKRIDLLDPLITEYLKHANCKYKTMKLKGKEVNLISLPVEKYTQDNCYDLLICVNVLEHCFDAIAAMLSIIAMLKVGGMILFEEKFFKNVDMVVNSSYDCGHPIRLTDKIIAGFCNKFNKIFDRVVETEDGVRALYFIGTKKDNEGK